jgi:hypothetical protein
MMGMWKGEGGVYGVWTSVVCGSLILLITTG